MSSDDRFSEVKKLLEELLDVWDEQAQEDKPKVAALQKIASNAISSLQPGASTNEEPSDETPEKSEA